jgi:MOSC domain-containing protein YiiM
LSDARGTVVSVNVAPEKGERKTPRAEVTLVVEHGVEGDGHAGPWHRQVSLLAQESIDEMRARGLDVGAGDFAENVTTQGIVVHELPVGTRLALGPCLVEVTQIGKVCHDRCAIFYQAGDCVMPREGIFARVLRGGALRAGDEVTVVAGVAPATTVTSEVEQA